MTLYETTSTVNQARPIRIKRILGSSLPAIHGDSAQLRQVLHNLLLNAQDALTEIDEPMIEIQTETIQDGVKLTIRDNGGGFPDEVRSRVFEPYVTTKVKGTGLGLPIVKKIVEEHEGTIAIQNLKPRGAQITITLPVMEKAA